MATLQDCLLLQVGEVVITKDDTLFLKGKGEQKDIERRCDTIRDQMESSTSDYEKEKMQERIAKMASGISDLPSYLLYSRFWIQGHSLSEKFHM